MRTWNVWISRAILAVVGLGVVGCGFGSRSPANGPYAVSIAPGLHPRLTPADAVSLSSDYLAEQTPELNVASAHTPTSIKQVWAVKADGAWTIDPCAPRQTSEAIVWVTVGVGDYLSRGSLPWMSSLLQAQEANRWCLGGASVGTIVIDDASGDILGAFPGSHAVATMPSN